MKTIEKFLRMNPSYTKWGTARLAQKTKLSESTVKRFKNSETYREIKSNYVKGL